MRTFNDVTWREKAAPRIRHAAEHDGPTVLLHRSAFLETLQTVAADVWHLGRGVVVLQMVMVVSNPSKQRPASGMPWATHCWRGSPDNLGSNPRTKMTLWQLGGDEVALLQRAAPTAKGRTAWYERLGVAALAFTARDEVARALSCLPLGMASQSDTHRRFQGVAH